jgi:hypothetical protein
MRAVSSNGCHGLAASSAVTGPAPAALKVVPCPRERGRGPHPASLQGDGCGGSRDAFVIPASPPAGVVPIRRRPIRARRRIVSRCSAGQGRSHKQKDNQRTTRSRDTNTEGRQRAARRFGRVRPSSTCRACHRSISGRSQRLGRPRPRSRTGRGMSGYRWTYWLTVLRWVSPRIRATSCASIRSSMSTRRAIRQAYTWQRTRRTPVSFPSGRSCSLPV